MNQIDKQLLITECIEEDKIILSESGKFPKKLIIIGKGKKSEYRLTRTQAGKYQLNK